MNKNEIMKKVKKILNKKITISETIGSILLTIFLILLGIILAKTIFKRHYYYEDIYNQSGISEKCKEKNDVLYCKRYVEVNWYYKM